MKIIIKMFQNGEEEATPFWQESVFSIVQAEEALGRLERFIKRKKAEEPLQDEDEEK
jgi:hypothetical protein